MLGKEAVGWRGGGCGGGGRRGGKLSRLLLNDDSQFINYYVQWISNYIYCNMTASSWKINLVNVERKGEIINVFYIRTSEPRRSLQNNQESSVCPRVVPMQMISPHPHFSLTRGNLPSCFKTCPIAHWSRALMYYNIRQDATSWRWLN